MTGAGPASRKEIPEAGAARANMGFLGRFRRITTSGKFIAEIDGLRFIAIAMVFAFHLNGFVAGKEGAHFGTQVQSDWLARVASFGHYGVQLFFVISGFILALPFAAHYLKSARAVSLPQYFLRRVTRLEPPYLLAMTLCFAGRVLLRNESAAALAPHLAAGFVYLHNLIYNTGNVLNYVAWSLEIEIQFYILVPVLAGLFAIRDARLRRAVILGLIAAVLVLQWFFIVPGTRPFLSILNYLQFFLFGFLLADIHVAGPFVNRRTYAWDVVTLFGWPLLLLVWRVPVLEHFVFPASIFVLYCAMFRGRLSNALIRNPVLTTIGGMCYTIYLLHFPLISVMGRWSQHVVVGHIYWLNVLIQTAILAPFVLAVSALYFLLIERPCMRRDWPRQAARAVRGWWRDETLAEPSERGAASAQ